MPQQVAIGEWFREAWELIKPAWLEYVLAVLVFYLGLIVATLLCLFPVLFAAGPLQGGLLVYLAKRVFGMPVTFEDVFKGFRRFGDATLLNLIILFVPWVILAAQFVFYFLPLLGIGDRSGALSGALGLIGGGLACLSFVFVVVYPIVAGTLLVFAMPLVMFKRHTAAQAIRASIEIVRPQFLNFLVFLLAGAILVSAASSVGTLLLCVGQFVLAPLAIALFFTMQLLAFRDFVGLTPEDLRDYA